MPRSSWGLDFPHSTLSSTRYFYVQLDPFFLFSFHFCCGLPIALHGWPISSRRPISNSLVTGSVGYIGATKRESTSSCAANQVKSQFSLDGRVWVCVRPYIPLRRAAMERTRVGVETRLSSVKRMKRSKRKGRKEAKPRRTRESMNLSSLWVSKVSTPK